MVSKITDTYSYLNLLIIRGIEEKILTLAEAKELSLVINNHLTSVEILEDALSKNQIFKKLVK